MPNNQVDPNILSALTEYNRQYRLKLKIKFSHREYINKAEWLRELEHQEFRLAGMGILLQAMSFTESDIAQIQDAAETGYWREVSGDTQPEPDTFGGPVEALRDRILSKKK